MLLVVEGVESRFESTKKVFEKMSHLGPWESCVYLEKRMSYEEAIMMEIGGYLDLMSEKASHMLVCTWDGFITNPHLWTDEWLEYDMVGSPWPKSWNTTGRVGNMGFNIQSRAFLKAAKNTRHLRCREPSDVFLCQKMKQKLEGDGIRFAPVELAAKFGWEYDIEEGLTGPEKSFGFHGWVNGRRMDEYYEKLSSLA